MPETTILKSIKGLLGIGDDDDVFDPEITIHINTAFSVLQNIGATPPAGFMLVTGQETWANFFLDQAQIQMVKTYIYLKVRQIFDPPAIASVLSAFDRQISEYEWRLSTLELVFNPHAYDYLNPPNLTD